MDFYNTSTENNQNYDSNQKDSEPNSNDNGQTYLKLNNTPVVIKRMDNKIDLKLFVGQISKSWEEKDVTEFFGKFGEIIESQVLRDRNGNTRSCAFVKFSSMTRAEKAIEELSKSKITLPGANAQIQIRWADGEPERLGIDPEMNHKLFIGSIPKEASEKNLKDVFERFGTIDELFLMKEQDNITSKGCCFIKYSLKESALLAIKNLHAKAYILNSDKPLEVRFAELKKKNQHNNNSHRGGDSNDHQNKNQMNLKQLPQFQQWNTMHQQQMYPFYGNQMYQQYYKDGMNPYFYNQMMMNPYDKSGANPMNPYGMTGYDPENSKAQYDYMSQYYQQMGYGGAGQAPGASFKGSLNDMSQNGKKQGPEGCNLFIFHIPNHWKDSDLFQLFCPYGNVLSARVMTEKNTGKSKGFGFVSYDKAENANKAVESLNGYQVEGKKRLKVECKKGDESGYNMSSIQQAKYSPY